LKYIIKRNGWYHFTRRVPGHVKFLDKREKIRMALKTQCPKTAQKMALDINADIEKYWQKLARSNDV